MSKNFPNAIEAGTALCMTGERPLTIPVYKFFAEGYP